MGGDVEPLAGEADRVGRPAGPAVVEVEGGAVVDRPGPTVPQQQVRVVPRAVDVRRERVQPDDAGGDVLRGWHRAVVPERAGQEVDAEVQPDAGVEQVLDLLVGLVLGDLRVQGDQRQPRDGDGEQPGDLGHEDLGDEDLDPLAGAAELQDVDAVVVGLDEARQGAALAQRRDVAGRRDALESGDGVHGGNPSEPAR